jgi:hypothetical protein
MEIVKPKYEQPLRCKVTALDGTHALSGEADYCVGYTDDKQGKGLLSGH